MYNSFPPYDEGIKTWQWVVTIVVILVLIVLGYFLFKGNDVRPSETDEQYCKRIGKYLSISQIPASCVQFYLSPSEREIYLQAVNNNK